MESDAEFLNRYWTELNWDTDDADFDRLFTLARRGAAADHERKMRAFIGDPSKGVSLPPPPEKGE